MIFLPTYPTFLYICTGIRRVYMRLSPSTAKYTNISNTLKPNKDEIQIH